MLERIHHHDHALALSENDPWVRWALARPLTGTVWHGPGTLAVERQGRRHSLVLIPLPSAPDADQAMDQSIAAIVDGEHLQRLGVASVTVPQQHLDVLQRHLDVGAGGDWEWMWTQHRPARLPAEDDVVTLDDRDDAEQIETLSREHSPTAEGEPGTGRTDLWLGVRGSDGLIAAGAMQRLPSGIPYLAGIVVHTNFRGQGLGAAVTAGLTRAGLADSGVCALSLYSTNDIGRALYHRLGYATAWAWASRMLTEMPAASR